MKSRSHRLPINEPPDDWGDGSWTVDCLCGVNFDDGEEMVNCDECGVWVHTRCSRYVKEETSFACDKCKIKKNRNDNEETEVAQLLVELPTKTISMENSYPPSAPARSSFRLWTEIPMEERVHVQGVPGGDPALFQGLSSVFTSELWKCSGYVPKKFNFQYREFPCWDEKQESVAKIDEESENPLDRGADALFSLSKEIVSPSPVEMLVGLRGSVEGGSREKKSAKKEGKKRETNGSSVRHADNGEMREANHLRPYGTQLGKRKKDNIRSKDLSGKKKARSAAKEVDGKKRVSTTPIGVKQLDSYKAGVSKVVETTFHDSKNREKATPIDPVSDGYFDVNNNRPKGNLAVNAHCAEDSSKKVKLQDGLAADAQNTDDLTKKAKPRDNLTANITDDSSKKVNASVSLEPNSYHADESSKKARSKDKLLAKSHHAEDFMKKVKVRDNLATNAYIGENISKEAWANSSLVEIVVKSENGHQAPTRTGSSSETVAVEVSLIEEPDGVSAVKKAKDPYTVVDGSDHRNGEKHESTLGDVIVNLPNTALSPRTLTPLAGNLRNVAGEVHVSQVQHSIESTLLTSLRPDIKLNTGGNEDKPKEKSVPLSSPSFEEKLDSAKHLDREQKITVSEYPLENHRLHEIVLSDEDAFTESAVSPSCKENNTIEGMIPISAEPCQNTEVIVSVGTLSVQESCSEPKHLKIEEPSKAVGVNSGVLSPLSQHKVVLGFGKSSSSVVIPKSEISGSCKPPGRPASPSTLRPIHFTKRVKANSNVGIKKDHTLRDSDGPTRIEANELLKGASHTSVSKHASADSKEAVVYSSPKAPAGQIGLDSSGPVESSSPLQPQNVSDVQNKATSSGFTEKGERFNQPASHLSSKVIHSSPMHPPAPVKSTLSDEELALLLHQELNSSPRVPRVPRVRHAGTTPQSASPTATSMLTKRTSSSGVKDHVFVSRRKSKEEAPKDASRSPLELVDEQKKIARALSSHEPRRQEQVITPDGSTKKEAPGGSLEVGHSAKKNAPSTSTITSSQSPSTEATDQNLSSLRNSPRDTSDADAGGISSPATHTLPGLLDEIMTKHKRISYEELCNAVLPHWNNLRKHNGERYAYSSHSQAVLDCLRNRNEWAQLVDRGPKTNAGRKKRRLGSEPPPEDEEEENEYGKMRSTTGKTFEAHPEDFPKGKRKARKRRRLALQGRGIRDVRKRQKPNVVVTDDDDLGSNSSENDGIFSEDSQGGAATLPIGSEASSSFDEAGSL